MPCLISTDEQGASIHFAADEMTLVKSILEDYRNQACAGPFDSEQHMREVCGDSEITDTENISGTFDYAVRRWKEEHSPSQ